MNERLMMSPADSRAMRLSIILSAMIFAAAALDAAGRQDDERPNIVLILADDLGYETVGCYGGTSYGTPNIDRLAAEGIRFERAYSMPLCTNTRIQLMTGKYNHRNWSAFGILDPKETTFGHLMRRAGYKTCIAGKWQLTSYDPLDYPGAERRRDTGMHPRDAGFDEYSLWHVGHTELKGSRYADPVIEENGRPRPGTAGRYGPDIWTDFIGDFMERHRDEPFFVYYSMALPHNPMVPTPDSPEWRDPALRHRDETRFAADMIRYTDKMVGKVVARIDALKLPRGTLILFYSDNGTNRRVASRLGDRLVRGGKSQATELGIRVPAVARWKGVTRGGVVSSALIDSVDFLPTILDAAGAAGLIPSPIDGVSFAPLLRGEASASREWVYIHQDPRPGWDKDRYGMTRVAIGQRFKLYEDGRLYDLTGDPFEETPLFVDADDEARREGRRKLQRVLDSMRPYPLFDPSAVPRPDPSDRFERYQFQDQGGYVVVEAEELPIPRDESWRPERSTPGYTGTGYLRSLREQPPPPEKGTTRVAVSIGVVGRWHVAVRCRSDHVSGAAEDQFWLKVAGGPWLIGRIGDKSPPGKWTWVDTLITLTPSPSPGAERVATFDLGEQGNQLWIAPRSAGLKIDRIVLYQPDQKHRALDAATPASEYNPW